MWFCTFSMLLIMVISLIPLSNRSLCVSMELGGMVSEAAVGGGGGGRRWRMVSFFLL